MSTTPSPFQDHASPILAADSTVNDENRSQLWDIFHQSKDANELAAKLQPLPYADDLKHKLWTAKQSIAPPAKPEPVDKVSAAISKMVALPPDVLDKAEQHPQVLKAFTTAATTAEPAPPAAPSEPVAAPKGKKTPEAEEAPQAPTDVPATPSQHALIHGSNGGHYHVPTANLDAARKIDPNLTVLHVEP
jgi:hypothetical protein